MYGSASWAVVTPAVVDTETDPSVRGRLWLFTNVTVPVGLPDDPGSGVTVAVKVTGWP